MAMEDSALAKFQSMALAPYFHRFSTPFAEVLKFHQRAFSKRFEFFSN
jgi:hypothetical protein